MPWTGLTAPCNVLKTSTTALSFRMVFWSIVRKFWWDKHTHYYNLGAILNALKILPTLTWFQGLIFADLNGIFFGGEWGGCWGKYWGKYLKFPDNHEAEQSVQSIKAKCTKGVLDLREQSVVSHLLVALQVIPGIHLVNITRHPIERISLFHHQ